VFGEAGRDERDATGGSAEGKGNGIHDDGGGCGETRRDGKSVSPKLNGDVIYWEDSDCQFAKHRMPLHTPRHLLL